MVTNNKLAALGLIIILGGVYVTAQALEHVEAYELVKKDADFPQAFVVPVPMSDTTTADEPESQRIEVYGFSFVLPSKLKARNDMGLSQSTLILENEQTLTVVNPQAMGQSSPFSVMDDRERRVLQQSFAVDAAKSNYDWYRAAFNATPKDISLFHPGARNFVTGWLLTTKRSSFGNDARDIYALSAGEWKGFEIGTPGDGATTIQLRLFDTRDQLFRLWIHEPKQGPRFMQSEINTLLASLRKE
jgi:hypothetical protein